MKAVILAGGEATRLRPLSLEIPKPLIPVQGKSVMEYLVENFFAFGCTEVFVVIKKKDVRRFFNWQLVYASIHKINPKRIVLVAENEPMGTLGIFKEPKFQEALLKDNPEGDFFVTNADELKDIDLKVLHKLHKQKGAKATIAMTKVSDKSSYGNVYYDDKFNKIYGFVEKKEAAGEDVQYISTGLYCVSKDVLKFSEKYKEKKVMFETNLFPELAVRGELFGYTHTGQFYPTDDFAKWEDAIINYKYKTPRY